jgi:hypothetical protein
MFDRRVETVERVEGDPDGRGEWSSLASDRQ